MSGLDGHPGPVSPFETAIRSNGLLKKDQGVAMNAISPRTLAVREQPLPEPVIAGRTDPQAARSGGAEARGRANGGEARQ
jgi:hypothetical protein